jgi:hypothetical protein
MEYVNFPWTPLEAALSIFNISLFLLETFFWEWINKSSEGCHQCRIVSFLKMFTLNRLFR